MNNLVLGIYPIAINIYVYADSKGKKSKEESCEYSQNVNKIEKHTN